MVQVLEAVNPSASQLDDESAGPVGDQLLEMFELLLSAGIRESQGMLFESFEDAEGLVDVGTVHLHFAKLIPYQPLVPLHEVVISDPLQSLLDVVIEPKMSQDLRILHNESKGVSCMLIHLARPRVVRVDQDALKPMHVVEGVLAAPEAIDENIPISVVGTRDRRLQDEESRPAFLKRDALERDKRPLKSALEAHVEVMLTAIEPLRVVTLVVRHLIRKAHPVIPCTGQRVVRRVRKITTVTSNWLPDCQAATVKLTAQRIREPLALYQDTCAADVVFTLLTVIQELVFLQGRHTTSITHRSTVVSERLASLKLHRMVPCTLWLQPFQIMPMLFPVVLHFRVPSEDALLQSCHAIMLLLLPVQVLQTTFWTRLLSVCTVSQMLLHLVPDHAIRCDLVVLFAGQLRHLVAIIGTIVGFPRTRIKMCNSFLVLHRFGSLTSLLAAREPQSLQMLHHQTFNGLIVFQLLVTGVITVDARHVCIEALLAIHLTALATHSGLSDNIQAFLAGELDDILLEYLKTFGGQTG